MRNSWWAVLLQLALMAAFVLNAWWLVDRVFRRRTWNRAGCGFWSQFVAWYGKPELSWREGEPLLTEFDLDPEESEDLHSWFDPHELAECPKCGHTAARLGDAGAPCCPACGVVSPKRGPSGAAVPRPNCGMNAFPISKDGAYYCPACGQVAHRRNRRATGLAPFECRRPLLEEGGEALARVCGLEQARAEIALPVEGAFEQIFGPFV